jgi:hypothetical protein
VTYTAHYAYDGDGNQVIAEVDGELRVDIYPKSWTQGNVKN